MYARSGTLRRHFSVFRGWSAGEWLRTLALALINLAAVLAIVIALYGMKNPVLNFSWLSLLATTAQEKESGTNLVISGAQIPWFGIAFGLLLVLNIPRLARREEEVFRRGTASVGDALARSVKFGFIHMIVGVPVCAGIGLTISGLFFTWRYMVGGVREATFAHALNNYLVLVVVALSLLGS